MELNLLRESVSINETLFEGVLELGVESDYVLPDYLSDITRVLKCRIIPKITSKQAHGEKIAIDGYSVIRLLYLSEDLKKIKTAEIKLPFSKSCDMKKSAEHLYISAQCRADYCNCRVINQRRIDVRGAVSISVHVTAAKQNNVITDVDGSDIQLLKKNNKSIKLIGIAEKQFSQQEDAQLTQNELDIETIVSVTAKADITDQKIITNKIILKGDAVLSILCQRNNDDADFEYLEKRIPFSQIVDMDGIDEECFCDIEMVVLSADAELGGENNDSQGIMDMGVTLIMTVKGYRNAHSFLVADAYSTKYQCDFKTEHVPFEEMLLKIKETCPVKNTVDFQYDELFKILDISAQADKLTVQAQDGMLKLTGDILFTILAQNTSNEMVYLEKNGSYAIEKQMNPAAKNVSFDGTVTVTNCAKPDSLEGESEIRFDIMIEGSVFNTYFENAVTDITVDEENPKNTNDSAALIIYFADEKESLWEIAKRYNTKQEKIAEENGLEQDTLMQGQMLLIPTAF